MANIDKKQKRWYSKSTFDSLDKTTIPVGTEIQVTGELGQADFDSDTNTKLNAVPNKLDKPSGNPTEDSFVKVSSTGSTSYKKVSDFFDTTVTQRVTVEQYFDRLHITTATINTVWSSTNDNQFKFKDPNTYGVAYGIALTPDAAPTEPSFIVTAADRTPTWKPVSELDTNALKVTIW